MLALTGGATNFKTTVGNVVKHELLELHRKRWIEEMPIGTMKQYLLAMVLNPCVKNCSLVHWSCTTAWNLLDKKVKYMLAAVGEEAPCPSQSSDMLTSFLDLDGQTMPLFELATSGMEQISLNEVSNYKQAGSPPVNTNALDWWVDNSRKYPTIHKLVLDVLCTPPSSASVESVPPPKPWQDPIENVPLF